MTKEGRLSPKRPPWPKVDVHQAPASAKEIFIKFGLLSTVRGIPRIFKARNKFLSSFWAMTVLIFLSVSFFQVYQIVSGFLSYDIKQEHTIRLPRMVIFPDITVCSLQPFRSKKSLMSDDVPEKKGAGDYINEYFFKVTHRIANLSYEQYVKSELRYGKSGQVSWSGDNNRYDYDDDDDDLDLDWWTTDKETPPENSRTDGVGSGWQERGRFKRARVPEPLDEFHLVDDETMRSILMTTSGLFQNIPSDLRSRLGHHSNILDKCVYTIQTKKVKRLKTVKCRIKLFQHPQYFNCYTISLPRGTDGTVLDVGINLFLDDDVSLIYPKHYTRDTDAQKHGVRVVIHDPNSYPDLLKDGHDVPPGMAANFILKTKRRKHLPPPYGKCSNSITKLFTLNHSVFYKYHKKTCDDQKVQQMINDKCHCIDPTLITHPIASRNSSDPSGRLPYCMDITFDRVTLSNRLACMYDQILNPPSVSNKECPNRCKRYEYSTTVDMAKWPHESFHLPIYHAAQSSRNLSFLLFDSLLGEMKYHANGTASVHPKSEVRLAKRLLETHIFQRNFVSLTVSRPNFEVTFIVDEAAIDLPTLMSRIGGIMSFWLGITFITVVEFVEVIYDAIYMVRKRYMNREVETGNCNERCNETEKLDGVQEVST